MQHLRIYNKQDILSLTTIRKFETRLGERVTAAADPAALAKSLEQATAEYVLVGIPEDIGVKADGGVGGIHRGRCCFDADGAGGLANFELRVDARELSDSESNTGLDEIPESGIRYLDLISPRRQKVDPVFAAGGSLRGAREPCVLVARGDLGVDDHAALRILHGAEDDAGNLLPERRGREKNDGDGE